MNHLDAYIAAEASFAAKFTMAELQAHRTAARERLSQARMAYAFAKDTFAGFPSDVSAEGVRDALTELEDSIAVAQEWSVPL